AVSPGITRLKSCSTLLQPTAYDPGGSGSTTASESAPAVAHTSAHTTPRMVAHPRRTNCAVVRSDLDGMRIVWLAETSARTTSDRRNASTVHLVRVVVGL